MKLKILNCCAIIWCTFFFCGILYSQPIIDRYKEIPQLVTSIDTLNIASSNAIDYITQEIDKSPCPEGMIEIEHDYYRTILHTCKKWISEKRDRCAEYYPIVRTFGKPKKLHFCIDKYEAGNEQGEYVPKNVTFYEAQMYCSVRDARICLEEEWTSACEGPNLTPYSYGWKRDSSICNIDKKYIEPSKVKMRHHSEEEMAETRRLDQSEVSGNRPQCHSAYGVYDLDSNVDEITYDPTGFEDGGHGREPHYTSALKGGYWAPVRNRCRPKTVSHNKSHQWYQETFRCCRDPRI